LINILIVRYQLDCSLHSNNRIYIRAASMPRLRSIVLPYMDSSMLYKIGLKPNQTISIIPPARRGLG
jgi:hypothetical protein